jgi:mannose-6-phosphate isomerase-like protein (cupin superfamily)
MAGVERRDFDSADDTRRPDKTRVDVVHMGGAAVARLRMEPGWTWSACIGPVAGTDSCQKRHVGVAQSGRLRVTHDDGTELEIGPGDAYLIEPGHDAAVLGEEPFLCFEFESITAEEFARS